jgi:hypothetical protein
MGAVVMYLPHVWSPEDEWIVLHDTTPTIVDDDDDAWPLVADASALPAMSWPFPFLRNAAPKPGKKVAPLAAGTLPSVPSPSPTPRGRRAQRGVEFLVGDPSGVERPFRAYNDAAGFAVGLAASTGKPVILDVFVMSREGAAERIEVRAKSLPRR